jgi:AcrR family transcriptional regulator
MRTKGTAHDETRARILKAARSLVLADGHHKLSLREVARSVELSPASLYEYFEGRDAILATLAQEAAGSLRATLERSIKDAKSDRIALVALGLGYVAWAKAHREDFLLFFDRLPSKRQSLAEGPASSSPYRVVLESVQRAQRSGAVSVKDREGVEQLAYAIWASAHGMAMLQLTHLAGFKADFASADRALLTALIDGWKG